MKLEGGVHAGVYGPSGETSEGRSVQDSQRGVVAVFGFVTLHEFRHWQSVYCSPREPAEVGRASQSRNRDRSKSLCRLE